MISQFSPTLPRKEKNFIDEFVKRLAKCQFLWQQTCSPETQRIYWEVAQAFLPIDDNVPEICNEVSGYSIGLSKRIKSTVRHPLNKKKKLKLHWKWRFHTETYGHLLPIVDLDKIMQNQKYLVEVEFSGQSSNPLGVQHWRYIGPIGSEQLMVDVVCATLEQVKETPNYLKSEIYMCSIDNDLFERVPSNFSSSGEGFFRPKFDIYVKYHYDKRSGKSVVDGCFSLPSVSSLIGLPEILQQYVESRIFSTYYICKYMRKFLLKLVEISSSLTTD